MKAKNFMLTCAAIIPLLAGCASKPVILSPVGPGPVNRKTSASVGFLIVYTDIKTRAIGDNTFYYTHMGYTIYDKSGKAIQYIPNHVGSMDESPTLVKVPSGQYDIVAESSSYGRVTVPIVIAEGRQTVVHLDRGWKSASKIPSDKLVFLPDGEAVGWRSSIAKATQ